MPAPSLFTWAWTSGKYMYIYNNIFHVVVVSIFHVRLLDQMHHLMCCWVETVYDGCCCTYICWSSPWYTSNPAKPRLLLLLISMIMVLSAVSCKLTAKKTILSLYTWWGDWSDCSNIKNLATLLAKTNPLPIYKYQCKQNGVAWCLMYWISRFCNQANWKALSC